MTTTSYELRIPIDAAQAAVLEEIARRWNTTPETMALEELRLLFERECRGLVVRHA